MRQDRKTKFEFKRKYIQYGIISFVIATAVFCSFFLVKDLGIIYGHISVVVKKLFNALIPLFLGAILAYLFNKPVMALEKAFKKVKGKRIISIIIVYVIIFGAIVGIINFVVPKVQQNLVQLINNDLPEYSSVIRYNFEQTIMWAKEKNITFNNRKINDYIDKFSNGSYIEKFSDISNIVLNWVIKFATSITHWVFNFSLAMVLAFYMLLNKEKLLYSIKDIINLFVNKKYSERIFYEADQFNLILGGYISGVLIDAINMSILATLGLFIIGHKYFLLMGITVGTLNLIPYFGSIISTAIGCTLGLFQGIPTVVYTLIVLISLQQIDGNIIQPKIIGKRVGLGPLWVITAVLAFGSFWGVFGMILAVPFTALLKTILERLIQKKREKVQNEQLVNTAPEKK